MTTQAPSQQSEDDDGVGFLARNDASRTTFRTRNPGDPTANSNTNNSEMPEEEEEGTQTESSQLTESQTLRCASEHTTCVLPMQALWTNILCLGRIIPFLVV